MAEIVYEDHDMVKFIRGFRDSIILSYDGYLYLRINGGKPRTTWRCTQKCQVTVTTLNGKFLKAMSTDLHEHPPQITEYALTETRMIIKKRVQTEPSLTPGQIYSQESIKLLLRYGPSVHLALEPFKKCSSRYYKNRKATLPKDPMTRAAIHLDDKWKQTIDESDRFLLAEDGNDDKILIFATQNNLEILCNSEYVVADGTFKIQPKLFYQLYIFHAPYLGKVLPLVFCLLPDKSKFTYIRLLSLIRNAAHSNGYRFSPRKIHVDYEMAMIQAIASVFSYETVQGCLFHYTQCIWRKVQEIGIAAEYKNKNNKQLYSWVRRFSALALLPVEDIDAAWFLLHESTPQPTGNLTQWQINQFLDYMCDTWIDDIDVQFKRSIWNQFHNEGPRTTNSAEGFHSKLNSDAKSRLSFYQFIVFLKNVQAQVDLSKFHLIGHNLYKPTKKTQKTNESIKRAKENYVSGRISILSYLDSVSISLKLE